MLRSRSVDDITSFIAYDHSVEVHYVGSVGHGVSVGRGELGFYSVLAHLRDVPVLGDIQLPCPTEHRVPLNTVSH